MPHELQLIVYHEISRAPAHWTMFIPDSAEAVDGKIIHIMGKQDAGYRLEIKQYDISRTRKRYTRRLIASIHDDWLPHLDSKARGVTVPARDRRSSDPFAVSYTVLGRKIRTEVFI
jgi:hypothetical protein